MQWKLLTTHITDFNNKNPPASVIDFWLLFLLTILQSDPSHMFEGILEAPLSCVFSFDFIRRSNIWTFDCCCFYVIYLIFFSSISRLPVVRMVKTCTATKIMFLCDNNGISNSFLYSLLKFISFHPFLLRL